MDLSLQIPKFNSKFELQFSNSNFLIPNCQSNFYLIPVQIPMQFLCVPLATWTTHVKTLRPSRPNSSLRPHRELHCPFAPFEALQKWLPLVSFAEIENWPDSSRPPLRQDDFPLHKSMFPVGEMLQFAKNPIVPLYNVCFRLGTSDSLLVLG